MKVVCENCKTQLSTIVESDNDYIVQKDVRCPVCQHTFVVFYPRDSIHYISATLWNRKDWK